MTDGFGDEKLLLELEQNPPLFLRTMLPIIFPSEIPWFHRAILSILTRKVAFLDNDPDFGLMQEHFTYASDHGSRQSVFEMESGQAILTVGRNTQLIMPRGFSKTSIAGVGVPIYNVCFALKKFTAYISHAQPHADQQIDNVKTELSSNERIHALFGNLKPERSEGYRWSASQFETVNGIHFVARGKGGQIRGLNISGQRPDQIILDDVEDDEAVLTPEQREKMKKWMYAKVMPAIAELDPDSTLTVLGTKLHEDSLLMTLKRDPQFTTVMLDAKLPNGSMLWPRMMNEAKFEAKKRSFHLAGQLRAFYNEYLPGSPAPQELKVFHVDKIKRVPYPDRGELMVAIGVDPAISEKRSADEAVIKVVGMGFDGKIYHLDSWSARGANPSTIVDEIFAMAVKWQCMSYPTRVGIESNAFQVALVHLVEEDMHRRQVFFELDKIMHKTAKDTRIRGVLAPRINSGNMHFCFEDLPLLEQLETFPGKHDDHPDALAMAVALLDPYSSMAAFDAKTLVGEDLNYEPTLSRNCP